jgi:hypothetical protein
MKEKVNTVLKYTWLLIFIFSSMYFCYIAYFENWKKAQSFLLIIPISILMFFMRRHKEKIENEIENKNENNTEVQ